MSTVLIDTNLLVLLAVGLVDEALIARHRRLSAFTVEDFRRLKAILAGFDGVIFCPNVLTEASNLSGQTAEPDRSKIRARLAAMIAGAPERYVASVEATARRDYLRLGLTDAVLLTLAENGGTLLTTDLDLYLAAQRAGFDCVNYNHVRPF